MRIGKIFLKGLMAILPIAITVALVVWLLNFIEGFFGYILKMIMGPAHYFPGLGLIIGLGFVFVFGLTLNAWFISKAYGWAERQLKKIPLFKTLYSSISDLLNFFRTKREGGSVVLVTVHEMDMLGFITSETIPHDASKVAVYIPLSYQIGGITLLIDRSKIRPMDMSVEKAMRLAVTAWVRGEPEPD